MAGISSISLPHATIPTQMFGNVNLQNAVMYVNDNFKALLDGANANVTATNDALKAKSDATHTHDEAYAAIGHIHQWQDIQGLSAMLDGKAELNHEHAQYLSSLPAHFHDVNSVNGLTDAIKGKADVNHRHNVGDIDELATELGNKASAAYVDQQVANIGNSIQPIVEDVVETKGFAKVAPNTYGQGQEYATAASLAATHPKDVAAIPADETADQKQAREIADIGTSAKAARADHQHRFSGNMGNDPVDNTGASDFDDNRESFQATFTDWSSGGDNGLKIVLYGIVTGESGSHYLNPVELDIASNGLIKSVKAVEDASLWIGV